MIFTFARIRHGDKNAHPDPDPNGDCDPNMYT